MKSWSKEVRDCDKQLDAVCRRLIGRGCGCALDAASALSDEERRPKLTSHRQKKAKGIS